MNAPQLVVKLQDNERAAGVIRSGENEVAWTALRDEDNTWHIVMHGAMASIDRRLATDFILAVRRRLELRKAA